MATTTVAIADYEREIIGKIRWLLTERATDARRLRSAVSSAMGPHALYGAAGRSEQFERLERKLDAAIVSAWRGEDESDLLAEMVKILSDEAFFIVATLSTETVTVEVYDGPEDDTIGEALA